MAPVYEYPVPEGFFPPSQPVNDAERVADDDVVVSVATEADLARYAHLMFTCFPEVWWGRHDPVDQRPPPAERERRLALRSRIWLSHPSLTLIKATITSTGEIAGFAGWHLPREGATSPAFAALPQFPPTFMPVQFGKRAVEAHEWPAEHRLTPAQWAEVWAAVNTAEWGKEFEGYDADRLRILGDTVHWYLAPVFVDAKYRGKGVGGKLMEWGLRQADARGQPVWLEALPNARGVYYRYGFRPVVDSKWAGLIRNGPDGVKTEEV